MTGATEELLRISEEFLRAIASRNSEALDTILDEGFVHLQSGGERLTRDEFVSNIADAPYTVEEIDFESIRVEVQENVAVAAVSNEHKCGCPTVRHSFPEEASQTFFRRRTAAGSYGWRIPRNLRGNRRNT